MIPLGIVAAAQTRSNEPVPVPVAPGIVLPLTYAEADCNGLAAWTRTGGPIPTPDGGLFDGFSSRLKANSGLPSWVTSSTGPLLVHGTIAPSTIGISSTENLAIAVCGDSATFPAKLGLAAMTDSQDAGIAQMAAVSFVGGAWQRKRLARWGWRYEGQYPEIMVGPLQARPQGILFLDANTVLLTAHYQDAACRCHKVRLSDGEVLGWFDFPSPHLHVASIARSADGSIWFGDYAVGHLLKVDLDASFAAGTAQILVDCNLSAAITGAGAIAFTTYEGTEYLLAAAYTSQASLSFLYVIPMSLIHDGGSLSQGDRFKRFVADLRMQGVTVHDGFLYISSSGGISQYPLDFSMADGSMLVPNFSRHGPGQYVEDIDFHPSTGDVWTSTEGCTSVGSDIGWLALWSSPLDNKPVENHYTLFYNGAGTVTIKINGRLFEEMAWTPTAEPTCVTIGARPTLAPPSSSGFFNGIIKNVVILDRELTSEEYQDAVLGRYEDRALTTYEMALTNPGGEAGDASGWTNEVGALAVRAEDPMPHSGSFYFYDAGSPSTLARQRAGVPGAALAAIDAGLAWVEIDWWQASYSSGSDRSACGVRTLNAAQSQLSQSIANLIRPTPRMVWHHRRFNVAVPAGTRYLDALIAMERTNGTASDGYTDDVSWRIYVAGD